jgi:putative transcriptional regulator
MSTAPTKHTIDSEELRRRRIAAGLSQTALAEAVGKSGATISYIESGDRQPSPALLVKIARALGCESTDLMPAPVAPAKVAA